MTDTNFIFKNAQKEEKARILGCMASKLKGSYGIILNHYPAHNPCELGYDTVCYECGLAVNGISAYAFGDRPVESTRAIIKEMKKYIETTEDDLTGKPIFGVMIAAI